jgi:type VI secretion system protein ImpL
MWLWILSALIVALAWGGWFILGPTKTGGPELIPIWVPIAITALVVLVIVGIIVFRRIRAARAARALEKAIAQQAQEQALAAKPERAAEIQELHRQFQQGIGALKASSLAGGKSGADALYALPWYVMVGPPGAGKTTALRHSGLVFPYLDPNGGGVRGVGGTRNCDWWFTNEAILLDTAGRYTTESDDHEEWMAFLGELLKFRSHKPINGVIIAVSISELLDVTEDQIQVTAKLVRARIDEMQNVLKMILPVYVIFTKADLVAGFTEFFGDLKKSERGQAWGATFKLSEDKREPGKLFDAEFDILVEHLHTRGMKRMALERSREVKEKVYQFPLEFAAIKRNLSDFLAATFAPGAGAAVVDASKKDKKDKSKKSSIVAAGAPPILRGFYFTSGVQEGRPLDRVVGAMGRAFGLRGAASEEVVEKGESKSFFLKNVFEGVIFPDQTLASRTEAELTRMRTQRILAAAAALMLALLFLIPAAISYAKNQKLVAETAKVTNEAKDVRWTTDGGPAADKVDKLDNLRNHAQNLDTLSHDAPVDYTFLMFQADKLFEPTKQFYASTLREGFVHPTRDALEKRLASAHGDNYVEDFDTLKTYLLLGDDLEYRGHLLKDEGTAQWETDHLTRAWADQLRANGGGDVAEEKLRPHVKYFVDLLSRGEIKGEKLDTPLVERVRDDMRKVGSNQVYYDRFVTALIDRKIDPSGPDTSDNKQFPPITLGEVFADRSDALDKIHSYQKQHTKSGKFFEVRGPFTFRGHVEVLASLEGGAAIIQREKWVIPLSGDEATLGPKVKRDLDRVRQDYDNAYIQEWINFFKDLEVESPTTNRDSIIEYKALSTPEWPYQRLLRVLADNTQFDEADDDTLDAVAGGDAGVIEQLKLKAQRKLQGKTRMNVNNLVRAGQADSVSPGERPDPIPLKFKSMVRFGSPPPQKKPAEGEPPPPPLPVPLGEYISKLQGLAGEMGTVESGPPNADTKKATVKFEEAVQTAEGLLLKMDDTGQLLMTDLLMNPLRQGYKAVVRNAGGAASGLWEVMVYPTYRDKIKDRYPFNLASTRDASFEDATAFFKPKDGVLWGFYDAYLKAYHVKQNHDFIPESHLETSPKAAKPFTPFNANMYNCLKRADEITDALFAGGEKPHVEFQVNVKTVSPIVSEIIFELDGNKRVYRNEKEFWLPFAWPGPKPGAGASIRLRGAGGLDEQINREGPWGMFRLMEAGTSTSEKDNDDVFNVTWEMTAPPVSVTLEIRPTRANHPFPSSFFRATNCPPSIGDKFGKGKG